MEKFRLFNQHAEDYIWKHLLMKALTMKVKFTWDRVCLGILAEDGDFQGVAFDPFKV